MLPHKPLYNRIHFINILLSPNICVFWDTETFLHSHSIFSILPNLTFLNSKTQKFKFDKFLPRTLSPTQNEPKEPKRSQINPHLDHETAADILLEDAACMCFDFACSDFACFFQKLTNRTKLLKSPKKGVLGGCAWDLVTNWRSICTGTREPYREQFVTFSRMAPCTFCVWAATIGPCVVTERRIKHHGTLVLPEKNQFIVVHVRVIEGDIDPDVMTIVHKHNTQVRSEIQHCLSCGWISSVFVLHLWSCIVISSVICKTLIVKYILDTRFKSAGFVLQCISLLGITCLLSSAKFGMVFYFTEGAMSIMLCEAFVDPTDSSVFRKVATVVTASVQLMATVAIMITHCC